MEIALWIREGVWEATVDAGLRFAGDGGNDRAGFVLLHGVEGDSEAAMNAGLSGLLGRGRSRHVDAGWQTDADSAAEELLAAAEHRLGLPAQRRRLTGRIEREVVVATEGADLLILSRDGDRSRLGPHSLGPHTRFVVDHAACPVLLVLAGRVTERRQHAAAATSWGRASPRAATAARCSARASAGRAAPMNSASGASR